MNINLESQSSSESETVPTTIKRNLLKPSQYMNIFLKSLLGFTRNSFTHISEICDLKVLA